MFSSVEEAKETVLDFSKRKQLKYYDFFCFNIPLI